MIVYHSGAPQPCAGCGAGGLAQLLEGTRVHQGPRLLVGFDKSDVTSVYKIREDLAEKAHLSAMDEEVEAVYKKIGKEEYALLMNAD